MNLEIARFRRVTWEMPFQSSDFSFPFRQQFFYILTLLIIIIFSFLLSRWGKKAYLSHLPDGLYHLQAHVYAVGSVIWPRDR